MSFQRVGRRVLGDYIAGQLSPEESVALEVRAQNDARLRARIAEARSGKVPPARPRRRKAKATPQPRPPRVRSGQAPQSTEEWAAEVRLRLDALRVLVGEELQRRAAQGSAAGPAEGQAKPAPKATVAQTAHVAGVSHPRFSKAAAGVYERPATLERWERTVHAWVAGEDLPADLGEEV